MERKPLILVVDRNWRNLELLSQFLDSEGYQTIDATSLEAFDQILAGEAEIALALVDVTGFTPDLWARCDQLREAAVPFLLLSPARQSAAVQQAGIVHGSMGVMTKPLASRALLDLIRSVLET